MSTVREAWTDERLDDLNDRVAEMARRMDEGFAELRAEIRALRSGAKEIRALHRLILRVGGGMIATLVVGILGLLATQL
jgi:hypothetical protein